jgi:hypothetical protein
MTTRDRTADVMERYDYRLSALAASDPPFQVRYRARDGGRPAFDGIPPAVLLRGVLGRSLRDVCGDVGGVTFYRPEDGDGLIEARARVDDRLLFRGRLPEFEDDALLVEYRSEDRRASGGRYRQWFPEDADYPHSPTHRAIFQDFGAAGLALWTASNAAAQRSAERGVLTYCGGEAGLLALTGLHGMPLVNNKGETFAVDEYWAKLGRLHETRRTTRGEVTTIELRHWEDGRKDVRRRQKAEQKRSSRGQNEEQVRTTLGRRWDDPEPDQSQIQNSPPDPEPSRDASDSPPMSRARADGGGEDFAVRKTAEELLGQVEMRWALTPEQASQLAELSITRGLEVDLAPAGDRAPDLIDRILADPPAVVANPAGLLRARTREAVAGLLAEANRQRIRDCPSCSNGWVLDDEEKARRCQDCNGTGDK